MRLLGAQQFGFVIVDWAQSLQIRAVGAFLLDTLQSYRNSVVAACVTEAAADAWRHAAEIGDSARADRRRRRKRQFNKRKEE
jgi:hypothetical protein